MSGYYLIVSELNGMALDVDGSSTNPGAKVFTWQKHGRDNQQFYDDPSTGTIRSKLNAFCLDIEHHQLVLKPFQQGDQNQQWERRGHHIVNRYNQNEVLDIAEGNAMQGARICKYQNSGAPNQRWTFEFVGGQPPQGGGYPSVGASTYPGYPGGGGGAYPGGQSYPSYPSQQAYPSQPQRQEFYIVSEMNNKVIDIKGASRDVGAHVIMWSKNADQSKNQRWYLDPQGYIRSALTDMPFSAQSGHDVKMAQASGDPHSQWRFDGNKVVNQAGDALDIVRGSHDDGASICAYKPHGKENQRWRKEF